MEIAKRRFQINDLELRQHCEVALGFLESEDLPKFAGKDITYTTDKITELRAKIDDVRRETDEIIVDRIAQLTNALYQKIDEAEQHYRDIRFFARKVFRQDPARMAEFGTDDFQDARSRQLDFIQFIEMLAITVGKYTDELLSVGATQALLDRTAALVTELHDANNAQEAAKRNRRTATQERIRALNALYLAFQEIEELARLIFRNDLARFERYFIPRYTRQPHPETGELPTGIAVAANTKTTALSGESVGENELITAINRGDVALTFYVADSPDAEAPETALVLAPGDMQIFNSTDISNGTYGLLVVWNSAPDRIGSYQATKIDIP